MSPEVLAVLESCVNPGTARSSVSASVPASTGPTASLSTAAGPALPAPTAPQAKLAPARGAHVPSAAETAGPQQIETASGHEQAAKTANLDAEMKSNLAVLKGLADKFYGQRERYK